MNPETKSIVEALDRIDRTLNLAIAALIAMLGMLAGILYGVLVLASKAGI